MNIAIGKIGRSCYFNKKRWSIHAGDDTPLILYRTLCEAYPQHTFYMIGPNDYQRCLSEGLDPMPKNFVDWFGEFKKSKGDEWRRLADEQYVWKHLIKYSIDHKLKIDFGILLQGPDFSASLAHAGIAKVNDPDHEVKVMCAASNYVAPIIGMLNFFKFPWIDVNEDMRYIPLSIRDILNDEICILSQSNAKKVVKRITGYNEKSKVYRAHELIYKYAGMERMFLADYKKVDFSDPDHIDVNGEIYQKKDKFIIAVNGGGNRLSILEKWILDKNPTQVIYGKFSDEDCAKHPGVFVPNKSADMEPLMSQAKYTFIPSFFKSKLTANFVTQKVWKMMYYGIIPFFDKNGYDTDHYLEVPDFCRVETPEEMWKKIDALEKNPDAYRKLLRKIYSLLDDKYFNGGFIKETFGPYIDEYAKKADQ